MEESNNQLSPLTENQVKLDREKKSLNRRFGFLLVIAIILGLILVAEIIMLSIK